MRVSKSFGSYNERRYSKPWIAVITSWPIGRKPEVKWGSFMGRNGDAGETEIEANPNDIIRWGQKDFRGKNTEAEWGIVQNDGTILDTTPSKARKHWEEQNNKPLNPILVEIKELLNSSLKPEADTVRIYMLLDLLLKGEPK